MLTTGFLMLCAVIIFWFLYAYKIIGNEIGTYDVLMDFVKQLNEDFGGSYLLPMYWGTGPPTEEETA